jgi:hypothetical protein
MADEFRSARLFRAAQGYPPLADKCSAAFSFAACAAGSFSLHPKKQGIKASKENEH